MICAIVLFIGAANAAQEVLLSAAGPIAVEQDNPIGNVPILNEMHFEMDITIAEWPTAGWRGLFQCGAGPKDRYPLVMISPLSATDGPYTWYQDGADTSAVGGYAGIPMELNTAYHLEIDFTQNEVMVTMDGDVVLLKDKSRHALQSEVPCGVFSNNFAGSGAAAATISNLIITSPAEPTTSSSPCSTQSPPDGGLLNVQCPMAVASDNVIGYIDIEDEMHFEMDFTVNAWPISGWAGLLQCGSDKKDRYPLVMMRSNANTKGFYSWFRDGASSSRAYGGWSGVPMELDQEYHLEIDFTQSHFVVSLDGVVVVNKEKAAHSLRSLVPCAVFSDNWNGAAATVSNLYIDSAAGVSAGASAMQSGAAPIVSDEQSVAASTESSSSLVIGMVAFGVGALSALALLKLKQKLQQKAAMKPAQEEHVPEVSVSAVPETTTTEMAVAMEMEAKQETV